MRTVIEEILWNMNNTWRDCARPIINKILEDNAGADEKTIRKALRDAYPFGQREMHPYKIWLDEIKVQRKQRIFGKKPKPENKNQGKLF